MREFTIAEIQSLCEASALPLGVPLVDDRLEEYAVKYSGKHAYYATLRDIVRALRPGVVLEIGTWQGTSAAAFAAGCEETEVITLDHHSDPGDEENQKRTLEACDAFPNISYIQGCSTEMVRDQKPGTEFVMPAVLEFLEGRKIDILFIDGWHGGEFARADFDTYAPLLSENALVICDDIVGGSDGSGDSAAIFGMRQFWDGLPGEERYLDGRIHAGYPMGFLKFKKTGMVRTWEGIESLIEQAKLGSPPPNCSSARSIPADARIRITTSCARSPLPKKSPACFWRSAATWDALRPMSASNPISTTTSSSAST